MPKFIINLQMPLSGHCEYETVIDADTIESALEQGKAIKEAYIDGKADLVFIDHIDTIDYNIPSLCVFTEGYKERLGKIVSI